jgi:type IV secretory pathway protease TraF
MTTPGITLGPGQYFLLGDNRPYSEDSRCYGPVPFQDFVGKVLIP